jgi:hypothetical protein
MVEGNPSFVPSQGRNLILGKTAQTFPLLRKILHSADAEYYINPVFAYNSSKSVVESGVRTISIKMRSLAGSMFFYGTSIATMVYSGFNSQKGQSSLGQKPDGLGESILPNTSQRFQLLTHQFDSLVERLNESPSQSLEEQTILLRKMKVLIVEIDMLILSALKRNGREIASTRRPTNP